MALRIAMWSGPRNISTALLRAWENRGDAAVTDEPLYGHYLHTTGRDHPGREAVIASQDTDWRRVAADLTGPVPGAKPIWYQKHMCHHLLAGMEGNWLDGLDNCFLIRDPREMMASYAKVRAEVTLADLGLPQQRAIFDRVRARTGRVPPVIDGRDVLEDPRRMLGLLCQAVSVDFSERMLSWPAGPRDSDGVWAAHWYDAVLASTGFRPYESKPVHLTPDLEALAADCLPYYLHLHAHRLGG